ncbi:MAG: MFS transporter [Myxococcales bacterium]|nr:MFS transporter [Myxococcales bacterium]
MTLPGSASPTSGAQPEERVRFRTRILFGLGSVSEGTKNTAFNVFLLFYYNQVLGLSGTLSGIAIFIALAIDAITDPLVGSISDHTHSRWGRRHPYMYAAALPMGVCFYFLFSPPSGISQVGLFIWLAVFAVGVRASMTLYAIPSASMVPEMTSHYDERTTLFAYRFLFGWVGGLTASVLGYQVFFRKVGDVDGRLVPEAYQDFALVAGLMMFAAILVCALGTHYLIPKLRRAGEERLTARSFFEELAGAFRNRSYRNLVMGMLFASVAGGFNDVVGLYMNTYFWEFTTDEITLITLGLGVSVLVGVVASRPLSERFDKKPTALALAVVAVGFGPFPVFLRLLDLMPANRDPLLLYLMIGHAFIIVTAIVMIGIIISSMISDVIDENELETGRRQEGLFFSALTFCAKASSGIGGLLAGVALDVIAFPRLAAPGSVDPEKLFSLGMAVGPGLVILFFVLVFFLSRYGLTRERHREILAELARRRAPAA